MGMPSSKRLPSLQARRLPLALPQVQRAALRALDMAQEFDAALASHGLHPLSATGIDVLQVNLGKLCNQTCRHCHVDAGPDRDEIMMRKTMEECLRAIEKSHIRRVDLTGGAPELNPHFRWFVEQCRALGCHVIDRCNLTILLVPRHRDLPDFFAQHQVEVVCSLPHYRALGTDAQRGEGVFAKSIEGLRRLNALGYGQGDSRWRLTLVTNPVGAFLPADQKALEQEWKRELDRRFGLQFDTLFTITNMPISRFLEWLQETNNLEGYMQSLVAAYNPAAAEGVMCRNTLSVGWDGRLYDCDFNQMLDMPVSTQEALHIRDFDIQRLDHRRIVTDRHCFGCTAGSGSSCGGATVDA